MALISILILSHNRQEDLKRNLTQLLSVPTENVYEFIVVDNASTDGTPMMLKEMSTEFCNLRVFLNKRNLGVAEGRNVGLREARGEYIISLDDDSEIQMKDVEKVPLLFEENPEAGIIAFKICHAKTGELQNDHGFESCKVANHHGAGAAFRRDIFDQVGYIDEGCSFGSEEIDICIRARTVGYSVVYIPDVLVLHNNFRRENVVDKKRRELRVYNNSRIMHKYFPSSMALIFSLRYLTSQLLSVVKDYGLLSSFSLVLAAKNGRKDGRRMRVKIDLGTIKYYSQATCRPDYGNVPITTKLFRKIDFIPFFGRGR